MSVASFARIFSLSEGFTFLLFMVSFAVQKLFRFNWVPVSVVFYTDFFFFLNFIHVVGCISGSFPFIWG